MPLRFVAILAGLAVLIATLSLLLLRLPAAADTDAPLVPSLAQTAPTSIAVTSEGAPGSLLTRDDAGGWRIAPSDEPEMSWPGETPRVRSALRAISDIRVAGRAEPRSAAGLLSIALELPAGDRTTLLMDSPSRAVGGRVVVSRDDGAFGYAEPALAEALVSPGPFGWRTRRVFPGVGAEASRIEIEREGEPPLQLARVRGRWTLRAPLDTRADHRAADALLDAIASLPIERFLDAPPPQTPSAIRIAVETDTRRLDAADEVRIETQRWEAMMAVPSGDEPVVGGAPGGPWFLVAGDAFSALPMDIDALLAQTSFGAPPAEVGMVLLRTGDREIAFRRDLLSWRTVGDGAAGNVSDDDIDALLAALCERPADSAELAEHSTDAALTVQLFDLYDQPLGTVRLARGDGALYAHDGAVLRRYPLSTLPDSVLSLLR